MTRIERRDSRRGQGPARVGKGGGAAARLGSRWHQAGARRRRAIRVRTSESPCWSRTAPQSPPACTPGPPPACLMRGPGRAGRGGRGRRAPASTWTPPPPGCRTPRSHTRCPALARVASRGARRGGYSRPARHARVCRSSSAVSPTRQPRPLLPSPAARPSLPARRASRRRLTARPAWGRAGDGARRC